MTTIATNTWVQMQDAYPGPSVSIDDVDDSAWVVAERQLRGLMTLRSDWDGNGAEAPPAAAIINAGELLRAVRAARNWSGDFLLPAPVAISATPMGEVLIVWRFRGVYIEAVVTADEAVEWMRKAPGHVPEHWTEHLGIRMDISSGDAVWDRYETPSGAAFAAA